MGSVGGVEGKVGRCKRRRRWGEMEDEDEDEDEDEEQHFEKRIRLPSIISRD